MLIQGPVFTFLNRPSELPSLFPKSSKERKDMCSILLTLSDVSDNWHAPYYGDRTNLNSTNFQEVTLSGNHKNKAGTAEFSETLLLNILSNTHRSKLLQFDFATEAFCDKDTGLLVLVCTLLGQFSYSNRARLLGNSSLMKRWPGKMP